MPLTGTATNSDKLDGYDSTDFQPISDELTALDQLEDTAGFVKKTGDSAYSIDTNTYLQSTSKAADSDKVDGYHATVYATANFVSVRDANGILYAKSFDGVNQDKNTILDNYGWAEYPSLNVMALYDGAFTNKFRFISATSQEESTDGINWTPSTRGTEVALANIMICQGDIISAINAVPIDTLGTYGGYRLTWDVFDITGTCTLTDLYLYCAPNKNETTFLIEAYHNTDGWVNITSEVSSISSGNISIRHDIIKYSNSSSLYGKVRLTISNTHQVSTSAFIIYSIGWFGTYQNSQKLVESYDRYKNATFPAGVAGTVLTSSIATGTSPLTIASTTKVDNLNVDLLDGEHSTAFQPAGNELTALQALADTAGFMKKVGDASYTIDTNTYTDDTNLDTESISTLQTSDAMATAIGATCYDESPLEAEVKGLTLNNPVVNSDFASGSLANWTARGTGATASTTRVKNGTYSALRVAANGDNYQDLTYPNGHIIYFSAWCYMVSGSINMYLQACDKGATTNAVSCIFPYTTTGVWQFKSALKTAAGGGIRLIFGAFYSGEAMETYMDCIMAIDLTAAYGAGNEPTAAQMDLIAPAWFDGTANVVNPALVSVGKNLFDGASGNIVAGFFAASVLTITASAGTRTIFSKTLVPPNTVVVCSKSNGSRNAIGFVTAKSIGATISNFVQGSGTTTVTATSPNFYSYVAYYTDNTSIVPVNEQIEYGSAATTYEAYKSNSLALTGTLRSVFDTATLYRDRLYRLNGVWKIDRYVNPSTGALQAMATEDAVITGNPIVYKNGTIYYTTTVIAPRTEYTYALNFRASYNRSEEYARYGADNSLKLNQTTQQTTVGTFKFPIVATSEIKTNSTAPTDLTITTGAAKTLVLGTVVYKDINIAGTLLHLPVSSAPGTDTFRDKNGADTTIVTYAFGVDEYLSGGFELQHDYKEGTDLVFHVHWQGIAAPTGTDNVQWRLTYIISRDNVVLEPAVTIDSVDTTFDTQYECKRTDFSAITGTTFKIGDQFMFNLYRVASTGDAYAGDALIQTVGIHYACDSLGSRTISTK